MSIHSPVVRAMARITALIAATSLAFASHAAQYDQLVVEDSAIEFNYTQMGVTLRGHFREFDGSLRFDPAAPESASAAIEVELASIRTGLAEADAEVTGSSWFNTETYPRARFESSAVRALGDNRFEVTGTLDIKGTTQEIVVPAALVAANGTAVFEGEFTIRRGDFAVGEGSWARFDVLANEIRVQFRITAGE